MITIYGDNDDDNDNFDTDDNEKDDNDGIDDICIEKDDSVENDDDINGKDDNDNNEDGDSYSTVMVIIMKMMRVTMIMLIKSMLMINIQYVNLLVLFKSQAELKKRRSTMIKTDAFRAFTARARWQVSHIFSSKIFLNKLFVIINTF